MMIHVNPLLAAVVAILVAAIAASGRLSLNAANVLLFVAWGAGILAVVQSGIADRTWKVVAECGVGAAALAISFWVTKRTQKKRSRPDAK